MRSTFLYENRVEGELPGLGVAGPVGVTVPAYAFASFCLVLVVLAFATGVYGGLRSTPQSRSFRILSSLLFLSASLAFVVGLSSALSEEGRSIFSSETLASSGSHITSGLAFGFYMVLGAVAILGFSYLVEKMPVKRKPLTLPHGS